jgi:uncharacterized protein (DUF302 family)
MNFETIPFGFRNVFRLEYFLVVGDEDALFSTYVSMGFADAVAATKKALERQKFAILTVIDMRQTLKEVSPSICVLILF